MLDRRHFIAAAGTLGAASPTLAANAAEAPARAGRSLDAADARAVMEALVKLRGSQDGRVAIWWLTGPRYGVVGTQVTPLFQNLVLSWHRFVRPDDGSAVLDPTRSSASATIHYRGGSAGCFVPALRSGRRLVTAVRTTTRRDPGSA